MKDIICQYDGKNLKPYSEEDGKKLSEYKENQLVRTKIYNVGAKKERSVSQLGLLHACFKLVADNTNKPNLNTPDKVKFEAKVFTDFRNPNICSVRQDGTVQFKYRSFSFENLGHMEACNIFDRCFEFMAKILKITPKELIEEAKSRMGGCV